MPQHAIGATLRSVTGDGAPRWMFLDVFEDGPAACAGVSPGHCLISVNGMPAVPPSFPLFRFGHEHHVTDRDPPPERSPEHRVEYSAEARKRAAPATRRAKKRQSPNIAEHWNIEDFFLFGGVWDPLLRTSRHSD